MKMTNWCNAQHDTMLAIIDRLREMITELTSIVDRLNSGDDARIATSNEGEEYATAAFSLASKEVRDERLRLVEAWADLESEERRLALQHAVARPIASTTLHVARPYPSADTEHTVDGGSQFELLQRECDRKRD